jgi:hypothetical protein
MLSDIWTFVSDANNRAVLGWIGGGIVVVTGGVWAVITFFMQKGQKGSAPPNVSASNGGVAAGRDIRNSKIDTRGSKR